MKRDWITRVRMAVFVLALLLCLTASVALAANATGVSVDGAILTALNPYWKNGGGGSASDWNLFFDTSTPTPTLKMKDAVLDTLNPQYYLVLPDGDVIVELYGNNSLTYTGATPGIPVGLGAYGSILIKDGTADKTGSLNVNIHHSSATGLSAGIMNVNGDITIDSATVNITVNDSLMALGIAALNDTYIYGGQTTVSVSGYEAYGITTELFQLSGGTIAITADGTGYGICALVFEDTLITGGYGEFKTVEDGFGALWRWASSGTFRVLGGHVIFSAGYSALIFHTNETLTPDVNGDILVSEYGSGIDKSIWN
ncbi:MAG: hypothetical protein ABIG45_08555, partial [Bacillota bacterium]